MYKIWEKAGESLPSERFAASVHAGLEATIARLVRRNVRLQDNDKAYILDRDMDDLSTRADLSLANLRSFSALLRP